PEQHHTIREYPIQGYAASPIQGPASLVLLSKNHRHTEETDVFSVASVVHFKTSARPYKQDAGMRAAVGNGLINPRMAGPNRAASVINVTTRTTAAAIRSKRSALCY